MSCPFTGRTASGGNNGPSSSRGVLRAWAAPVLLTAAAVGAAACAGALAVRHVRRSRRAAAAAAAATADPYGGLDPAHSLPLPLGYAPRRDYSSYDLVVLFPSTRGSEQDKHYATMASSGLPGAEAVLLAPQDAQKKACTYGLDDSEAELQASLRLLRPRSLRFVHVSLDSYPSLFADYSPEQRARTLVLNLCDGTELDGIPGLSVLRHLRDVGATPGTVNPAVASAASASSAPSSSAASSIAASSSRRGVPFTGASEDFFVVSTYKQRMKALFDARGVDTAPWTRLPKHLLAEWEQARAQEGKPLRPYEPEQDAKAAADLAAQSASEREHPAPNPCSLEDSFSKDLKDLLARVRELPFPVLVKPDDSYCSCGITTRAVNFSAEDAMDYAAGVLAHQFSGVLVEQFVAGREFTVLVSGLPNGADNVGGEKATQLAEAGGVPLPSLALRDLSSLQAGSSLRSYAPVERVFDSSLPFFERFISYELFWEISRAATELGKDEFVFKGVPDAPTNAEGTAAVEMTTRLRRKQHADACAAGSSSAASHEEPEEVSLPLAQALQEEALKAYIAVGGSGYARVDIRLDDGGDAAATKRRRPRIQVLEVNANCGITQYKQTAMGEILRESGLGFVHLLDTFFDDAIRRFEQQQL